jgi:hypothetical protein
MEQPHLQQRVADAFEQLRDHAVTRFLEIGGTAALAALALSSCGDQTDYYQAKGVVELGANGKRYIIPDGAERPIYKTDTACVTDVTKEIDHIEKKDNVTLNDKPAELCEPVSKYIDVDGNKGNNYFPFLYYYYFYGPILSPGSTWQSSQVVAWETSIPSGTFAAEGSTVEDDLQAAPEDDTVGEAVTEDEDGEDLGDSPDSYPVGSGNEANAGGDGSGGGDGGEDSGGDDGGDDDAGDSFGGGDDGYLIRRIQPASPLSRLILSWQSQPSHKHHGAVKVTRTKH